MNRLSDFGKKRIALEEKREIFRQIQETSEKNGEIPPTPPLFLSRYGTMMEFMGELLLGLLLGQLSILGVFVIFNLLFHLDLGP